jgi:hypothetical protein
MATDPSRSLDYEVGSDRQVSRIRGVDLPSGLLHSAPLASEETRTLSPEAVRTVQAAFDWASQSREAATRGR